MSKQLEASGVYTFPASAYLSKWFLYQGGFNYNEAEAVAADLRRKTGMNFVIKSQKHLVLLKNQNGTVVAVFEGEEAYPQFYGIDNSSQAIINLGDRQYRGRMEFVRYGGKGITAVNVVPFEEYLYGVVPSEMPSSWDLEALKAQAIVARNYAINVGKACFRRI